MSDSDELEVTYTDVSSPFEESPDIGSPRADDHEHLELPKMLEDPYVEVALQAPPSPDYIPGPEEPEQAPPSPDYVPGPEHSPKYVPKSDLEAHPEDDDDEDPEEDPVDYPADGGDDDDDKEGSSEDDEDDDMDIEADEEEEEHPAPADSVVVALTADDQALSAEETEPFETDESAATPPPHPAYRMTARISIPAPVPVPAWSDSEVVRLLAMSSPPSSPLSPWSSPPPQIPFPPLPPMLSPPSPVEIMRDPEREVSYGITDLWDEIVKTLQGAPMTEIRELHAADCRRQIVILEMLRVDHRRSIEIIGLRTALQGQVTTLQGQVIALQAQVTVLQGHQGPAGGPTQPELPEEAGSSS
nr:hypothetical protein [Tanacetum cinerariifolium]